MSSSRQPHPHGFSRRGVLGLFYKSIHYFSLSLSRPCETKASVQVSGANSKSKSKRCAKSKNLLSMKRHFVTNESRRPRALCPIDFCQAATPLVVAFPPPLINPAPPFGRWGEENTLRFFQGSSPNVDTRFVNGDAALSIRPGASSPLFLSPNFEAITPRVT